MNISKLYSVVVDYSQGPSGEGLSKGNAMFQLHELEFSVSCPVPQSKIKFDSAGKTKMQTTVYQYTENVAEYRLEEIEIIGHRGNGEKAVSGTSPRENTIDSFLLAYSKGAQMIELDIHLTIDGHLVVFHDNHVGGSPICMMTYQEFLKASNSSEAEFRSTNTTLNRILESLPEDLAVYLEIKHEPFIQEYPENYPNSVVEKTLDLIRNYPTRKFLFASFSPYICAIAKTCCPSYKTCFLMSDSILRFVPKESLVAVVTNLLERFGLDGIILDTDFYDTVKKEYPELLSKTKIVYGSGANDPRSIKKIRNDGITGFCTDNIEAFNLHYED